MRSSPVILVCIVLAAHHFRAGEWGLCGLWLSLPWALRHSWLSLCILCACLALAIVFARVAVGRQRLVQDLR